MKSPYIRALKRPAAAVLSPLRKNDTVIGTIGNTHGVRSIARPQSIASSISAHRLPGVLAWEELPAVCCPSAAVSPETEPSFSAIFAGIPPFSEGDTVIFAPFCWLAPSPSVVPSPAAFISNSQSSGGVHIWSLQAE